MMPPPPANGSCTCSCVRITTLTTLSGGSVYRRELASLARELDCKIWVVKSVIGKYQVDFISPPKNLTNSRSVTRKRVHGSRGGERRREGTAAACALRVRCRGALADRLLTRGSMRARCARLQIEAVINRLVEEKFQVRGASRRWPRARGCAHTLARARAPAGVCAHPRQALRSAVPPLPGGSE